MRTREYQLSVLLILAAQCTLAISFAHPPLTAPQASIPLALHAGDGLYTDIAAQYAPGYLWLQSGLAYVLPDPMLRARWLSLLLMTANSLILLHIARRWAGRTAALVALIFGVFWQGVFAFNPFYIDAIVGFFALSALALIKHPLWAGLALGLAIMMKQQSILIAAAFGGFYLWQHVVSQSDSSSQYSSRLWRWATEWIASSIGR